MAALSKARACAYFNYDPDTGIFYLKERPRSEFVSDLTFKKHLSRVGKPAGCPNMDGYIKLHIDGTYRSAHRVAWLMTHGDFPEYPAVEIDHINGDRSDNCIANLRAVTKSENQRNAGMRKNNKSGVAGVNWVASKAAWIARIWDGPRHLYLGQFYDINEAAAARRTAEERLGYTRTTELSHARRTGA